MGLRAKFNLLLIAAFSVRHFISAVVDLNTLQARAHAQVVQQANMIIGMSEAVRHYTVTQVTPALSGVATDKFLAQSTPFFAAKATLADFERHMPHYRFKIAALNPTNQADKAVAWEAKLIRDFDTHPKLTQQVITRKTAAGPILSLARPIRVDNPACLACHSSPAKAPPAMLQHYGTDGGFGWSLGSVPAAAIVSVPMKVPLDHAWKLFTDGLIRSAEWVTLALVLINFLLHFLIIRPVRRMATIASEVSLGNTSAPEFEARGSDEIASLGRSFNRMRRSFMNAMKLLEG